MIKSENVILASASPRRRDLLEKLIGDEFRVVASGVEEVEEGILPDPLLINAELKAIAVADREQDAFVIAADTGIILEGELLGKPENTHEAEEMLRRLSGKKHEVVSAVSIIMRSRDIQILFAESSFVTFKQLDDQIIEQYIQLVEPYDMAGAYGIQDHGEMLIAHVEGSTDNVMGLPTERLKETLILHGVELIDDEISQDNFQDR